MRIRSASYVVMALVLFLTAACGGSPTASNTGSAAAGATAAQKVYDQINGLTGDERTNTLLDLAKKDGTLSLYTSNTDMDDVVKAFEDKYGLKVETYRANSETVLQRVLQEASANYQGADLIETNGWPSSPACATSGCSGFNGICGRRGSGRMAAPRPIGRTTPPPSGSMWELPSGGSFECRLLRGNR